MNKLNILFFGALVTVGMVACDDKLPVAPPQANEQGPVLEGFEGATASLQVSNIELPTSVASDDDQTLKLYSVSSGTSGLAQESLWGEFEISNSSDFAESILLTQVGDEVGTVSLANLCEAHLQLFGKSPDAKDVYYRVLLYANVDGNNYRIGSYDYYGASGTYAETYDPGFVIEDTYYIIGIDSWDPGSEVAMSHAEGVSPYDDPNFTYTFASEGTVYWKIVTPDVHAETENPGFDAGASFWPFLYRGIPNEGNDLNGTLIQEDGDAPSVPAGEWTITVNMKDYTYSVSGTPAVSAGGVSGIYLRGSWSDTWDALPEYQFLATIEEGVYVVPFIHLTEGTSFKVADAGWGPINLGGAEEGEIEINKAYALDGGENIHLNSDFTGAVILSKVDDAYSLLLQTYEADTAGTDSGIYLRGGMNEWEAVASYQFLSTSYKDVMELANQTIDSGVSFKIADSGWSDVNLGSAGTITVANTPCVGLVNDGGSSDMNVTETFNGTLRLIYLLDTYWLQFDPNAE